MLLRRWLLAWGPGAMQSGSTQRPGWVRRPSRWQQQKRGPGPPDRHRASTGLGPSDECAGLPDCPGAVAEPAPRSAARSGPAGSGARAGGSSRSGAPGRRIATGHHISYIAYRCPSLTSCNLTPLSYRCYVQMFRCFMLDWRIDCKLPSTTAKQFSEPGWPGRQAV